MTLIADLIDIPERVHSGDFVLKLTEGVTRPDDTLGTYVVTPQLAQCFDNAFGFIRSAFDARGSKAAYLHGSFGSGKSHFMAVLHLLLQGNPAARSIPELAGVVRKHNDWTDGKKFLLVPYHLIGARSMESAILGQYVEHLHQLHPKAPVPAVYVAEGLLADARRLREQMGDDPFFHRLNQSKEAEPGGWGHLEAAWDAERFEQALCANPGSDERGKLISDLVKSFFASYRNVVRDGREEYVRLDDGLSVISRHAQALGYDALILFLDELILWLASNAADVTFVNREGQKLAMLVEAQKSDRPIPIVSFVARQRDLRELVGDHLTGAEQLAFADVLKWWEARFHTITLEDRNLPAIAERRVLKPRSPAARQQLDQAFDETKKVRDEVMSTLLTSTADPQMFRQVYPFSPALMQTLVAVSSVLQRERTALKVMVQLLVDQRHCLKLGDVVPVGDLFDVISQGDEAVSEVMRQHFENARRLYRQKLLPLLETQYGLRKAEVDVGPEAGPQHLAFRADDRLIKTLLLGALVPEVEALKGLTAARLAALNHGTIRSPIPGREGQMALTRCRQWAAQVGEIKIGDEPTNPTISVQLSAVDTETVLEKARNEDNTGNRRRKIKEILFRELGIEDRDEMWLTHELTWRGTRRQVELLYANVRELPDESLRARGQDWKVVIDFPFDEANRTPHDDIARLQQFRQSNGATNTLLWIPSFLSRDALRDLGKLVILDHILAGERFTDYASHLSAVDRTAGRALLDNQRSQLRQRLVTFLEGAYGSAKPFPGSIDEGHEPGEHTQSLDPTFQPQPPIGANLREAFQHLLDQALSHQFPAHPWFETDVRLPVLKKVYAEVQRAVQDPEGRVVVDKPVRQVVRQIACPLKLGDMSETHLVAGQYWRKHFAQKHARDGGSLTVARLRAWMDEPEPRGLPGEVGNLVALVFADQEKYAFFRHGGPAHGTLESLPDDLELRPEKLPDPDLWDRARDHASRILGLAPPELLNANNVSKFAQDAKDEVAKGRAACERLRRMLRETFPAHGVEASADRLRTAEMTVAFVEAVAHARPDGVVAAMATADVATSAEAMGSTFKKAEHVCAAIESVNWQIFETLRQAGDDDATRRIHAQVIDALRRDEHAVALGPALKNAEHAAVAEIQRRLQPPPPPPEPGRVTIERGAQAALRLGDARQLLGKIERHLESDPDARLTVTWEVFKEGKPR